MGKTKLKGKRDCSCTSRTPGNPKYGNGICYHSGSVNPRVRERIDGKRLCRAWKKGEERE